MLHDYPLVSIVIPIFNVSDYVKECLESVIKQTYRNIEILCIDDCGTDNSMAIVNTYANKDTRIRILKHSENKGLAPSRNFGITEAQGEFIFFLDSDDYIHTTTIQKLIGKATTSKADIVLCDFNIFLDQHLCDTSLNKRISKLNAYLTADFDSIYVTEKNYYLSLSKVSCVACGKLFKTKFITDNNLRFINEKVLHEDNGFHAKFLACNPHICCIHKKLYFYRIRPNSITQNTNNKANKPLNLMRSLQDSVSFILNDKNPSLIDELQDFYYSLFQTKNLFIKFYWGKRRKILKLLCIPVINYHLDGNNTKKLKVLGIRII